MKKLNIYIVLSLFVAGLMSCGDHEDFSQLYELTNEEIAEIARQDSVEQAQKEYINADLKLEYSGEILISQTLYDGITIPIEVDKIAELFGLSEEEVLAGIAGESGAPDIKGFAIEGAAHEDNGTASTTNAPWGHWWDANNKVTNWGDNAMIFCEFNTETGQFTVGQYPGHLNEGDTLKVIEALKYNDLRAAVVLSIFAVGPPKLNATVVNTQELSFDVYPKLGYEADPIQFDLSEALSNLGVSSMDEVSFVGMKKDGSYVKETTNGDKGFWFDREGFVGTWGDNASVFTNYGDFAEDQISIGQYPGHLTEGQTVEIKYGLLANEKIEVLSITVNVVAYDDPETAPGSPEDLVMDVELSKAYSNDYAAVTADIKEVMRNAFKMTTYQISRAILNGELKLYPGEVGQGAPAYTADAPGYWLKPDGTAGGWGESLVWCSIGYSETELYFFGGNHPDNAESGDTVTTTLVATLNGGSVTFNITFNVE